MKRYRLIDLEMCRDGNLTFTKIVLENEPDMLGLEMKIMDDAEAAGVECKIRHAAARTISGEWVYDRRIALEIPTMICCNAYAIIRLTDPDTKQSHWQAIEVTECAD